MKITKSLLVTAILGTTIALSANVSAFHEHKSSENHVHNAQLAAALKGEHRSDRNKARDKYRNPAQTLEFFGFDSSMTVVELTPGGGWYTEVLAPALKGTGKLYGAHYPDTGEDNYYSNSRKRLVKKLASDPVYSEVELTNFVPKQSNELAPAGTADLVLTFRNLHNWGDEGVAAVFKDAFAALKPGGVLGVVEHRLPKGVGSSAMNAGYYSQETAVKLAEQAGFVLEATSEINANPKDKASYEKGVWTLPPVLRLKDQDREKYMAIGESDRMTLKFRKPREFKKS